MIQTVIRFLSFNVMSTHPGVYWGLLLVWIILLVAAFSSVRSREMRASAKVVWMVIIFLVPLAGLACYAFWCLLRGDWSFLKPLMIPARTIRQISPQ
jgi:hypothetical protein